MRVQEKGDLTKLEALTMLCFVYCRLSEVALV